MRSHARTSPWTEPNTLHLRPHTTGRTRVGADALAGGISLPFPNEPLVAEATNSSLRPDICQRRSDVNRPSRGGLAGLQSATTTCAAPERVASALALGYVRVRFATTEHEEGHWVFEFRTLVRFPLCANGRGRV